jgi:hypothetical protein
MHFNKIDLIKKIREAYGLSLRDAFDIANRMIAECEAAVPSELTLRAMAKNAIDSEDYVRAEKLIDKLCDIRYGGDRY